MAKETNSVELWLRQQPPETAVQLRQFCREANALGPVQAFLVQQGASCPLPDIQAFIRSMQSRLAREFNEQNALYTGVDPLGTLDRLMLQLDADVKKLEERIDENLRDGDPLYSLTIAQAFTAKNAAIEKMAKLADQLSKQRASVDKSTYVWGVLARVKQLFMASAPVRDSEHESWLEQHWAYVLERIESEISK